jgi:hypothetical protein
VPSAAIFSDCTSRAWVWRHAGFRGDELEDLAVAGGERADALVENLDDAGHRAAESQGHAHHGARAEAGGGVHPPGHARVVLGVGHDDRFAGRGHRAPDALPHRQRHLAQHAGRGVALRHLPAQRGPALVEQHHRAGLGAQHLLGQRHELDQQRRQIEVGAQHPARLGEQAEQGKMVRGLLDRVVQPAAQRVFGIHRGQS